MPLVLHLPADHSLNARPMRRTQLWLAAQCRQWRHAPRYFADRRHLLEMDERLLQDVGLTREDVVRGVPFLHGAEGTTPR